MGNSKGKSADKKVSVKKETAKKVVSETKEKKEEKKKNIFSKRKAIIVPICVVVGIVIAIFVIRAIIIDNKYSYDLNKEGKLGELCYKYSDDWMITPDKEENGDISRVTLQLPERMGYVRIQLMKIAGSETGDTYKLVFGDDSKYIDEMIENLKGITHKQKTYIGTKDCYIIEGVGENDYSYTLNVFISDYNVYVVSMTCPVKDVEIHLSSLYKDFLHYIDIDSIVFTESDLVLKKGNSKELESRYQVSNNKVEKVKYISENEAIAKVEDGKVVAVGNGKCTIEAVDENGIKGKINVTVETSTSKVVLDRSEATIHINETLNIISRVEPEDSSYGKLTWTTSDYSIASVANGSVVGKKVGKATITATSQDGVEATCVVNVIEYTEQEFKDSCTTYSYEELFRNSSELKGQRVRAKGEVVQVIDGSYSKGYRISITEKGYYSTYYTDPIYVTYTGNAKILENDIVELYGIADGEQTYETIFNATKTIPKVNAKYIDVVGRND